MAKTIVISLGGSLIVPGEVDTAFLSQFRKTIEGHANHRFVIIAGGGRLARNYQAALSKLIGNNQLEMDWIGTYATHLNAHLVRMMFRGKAFSEIITDPTRILKSKKNVIIGAGWKPGWSTDYDSVLIAKQLKCKKVINMSNIDFVYDKDPRKSKDAKAFTELRWKQYRTLIGSKWEAGLNAPFDPIASKEAEKSGIEVCIIGPDLVNLGKAIDGKAFRGTRIF